MGRQEEALASYDRSIKINPNNAEAWNNRGNVLNELNRYEDAFRSYARAEEINPDLEFLLGSLIHTQMKVCDWSELKHRCQALEMRLLAGSKASPPFFVLGLFGSPELQRRCAEIYTRDKLSLSGEHSVIARRPKSDKIRVGYFSMDFCEHPVSHHIAELIESHDRTRYEVYGFSFGPNTKDSMRQRLEKAFDKLLDIKHLGDLDIVRLSRQLEIDIAVDLAGHTGDSRPQIFGYRAAPIQINFIGHPGTWGNDCMDYFIGDQITINESNRAHFSEKAITLTNLYACLKNYDQPTRAHCGRVSNGIFETAFVFCSFTANWKITPIVFDCWIRILKQVSNSILWLYVPNLTAQQNLRAWAKLQGLDEERLLFSEKRGQQYINQYPYADLFLDTFPYNVGSTFTDAILCNCPVVTLSGRSFASRMGAAQLVSCGLSELITESIDSYEQLAIELALYPEKLS